MKFELISSYILKVMNFLIFRNFFGFFSKFFWIFNVAQSGISDILKCADDVGRSGESDRVVINGESKRWRDIVRMVQSRNKLWPLVVT